MLWRLGFDDWSLHLVNDRLTGKFLEIVSIVLVELLLVLVLWWLFFLLDWLDSRLLDWFDSRLSGWFDCHFFGAGFFGDFLNFLFIKVKLVWDLTGILLDVSRAQGLGVLGGFVQNLFLELFIYVVIDVNVAPQVHVFSIGVLLGGGSPADGLGLAGGVPGADGGQLVGGSVILKEFVFFIWL